MSRFAFVGVLLLLLTSASGCSGGDRWKPTVSDIRRTDVYVANFGAERVLDVYIRSAGVSEWGENWLTAPILGGNLYAYVGEVLSGTYDVRMVGQSSTQEQLGMSLVGDAIAVAFHAMPVPESRHAETSNPSAM